MWIVFWVIVGSLLLEENIRMILREKFQQTV